MEEQTFSLQSEINDTLISASGIAEYEGLLRQIYSRADVAITEQAKLMLANGADGRAVARWANAARNKVKVQIRRWDMDFLRLMAEKRNQIEYLNKVGPSYRQLKHGWTTANGRIKPPKTDLQIIEGAAKSNKSVNSWTGRLRVAGRIVIAIEVGVLVYKVATAAEVDKPRILLEGVGGLAGAIGGAVAGAKACGAFGAAVSGPFAVQVAAVGATVCAIGGGIAGAYGGQKLGGWTAEQLYPIEQTYFEGDFAFEN